MPAVARPVEAPLVGIVLRCLAVLCFAALAVGVKKAAAHGAGLLDLIFWRNLISFPVILGWVLIGPGLLTLRTRRVGAHASRAAIGLGSISLVTLAIVMLPLAEQTAIGFSTPLFATALSPLLLGEHVGRHRWFAVGAGFLGVLVIVRPGGHSVPALALGVGVLAAAVQSLVHITLRQIGATERATTTVFWFNAASIVATALLLPVWGRMPEAGAWPWLLLMGVAGGIAQIAMTASLRYASVPTLAPFDYLQLIWAGLFGWIVFASVPARSTLLGAGVIAGSGIFVALRERRLHVARTTAPADAE